MPLDFDPRSLAHDEKRFMAFMLTAVSEILKTTPGLYERVIANFEHRGVNWNTPVMTLPAMAGNGQMVPRLFTMLDFNGKTVAQLRAVDKLSEEQINRVREAFRSQGLTIGEGEADGSTQRAMRASHNERPAKPPVAAEPVAPEIENPTTNTEPTFAGHSLSELAGKSDSDLLKIEGISRATIKEIRKAEKPAAE